MKIIVKPVKETKDIQVAVNCQPASDMQYQHLYISSLYFMNKGVFYYGKI